MKSIQILRRRSFIIDDHGRRTYRSESSLKWTCRYNLWRSWFISINAVCIFGDSVIDIAHFWVPKAKAQALVDLMLADENVLEIIVEDAE